MVLFWKPPFLYVVCGLFGFIWVYSGLSGPLRRYPRDSDASGHALAALSISKESNFQAGNWLFRIRGYCSNDFKPILCPRL